MIAAYILIQTEADMVTGEGPTMVGGLGLVAPGRQSDRR